MRSMILILVFPFVYDIFVNIGTDFANQLLTSLNVSYQEGLTANLATISAVGLNTAIL